MSKVIYPIEPHVKMGRAIKRGWKRFASLFTYKRFLIFWMTWNAFFAGFDFFAGIIDIVTGAGVFYVVFELSMTVFMLFMWTLSLYVYYDYTDGEARSRILKRLERFFS